MRTQRPDFIQRKKIAPGTLIFWRTLQGITWLGGLCLFFLLLFYPETGLLILWNILIPVAPLLFLFAAGVWRNICPLATTSLLPRHLHLSKRKRLSQSQSSLFPLIAVLLLYLLVPLRHTVYNTNGPATALLILASCTVAMLCGYFFEWKSAWCSGLCPVSPVEKLYGANVTDTMPNVQCSRCMNCVMPCPDSTPNIRGTGTRQNRMHDLSHVLITGGLPGFIWGWFQVPDEWITTSLRVLISEYTLPLLGLLTTITCYIFLSRYAPKKIKDKLAGIFGAAAISCYYWYRIPALTGFGQFTHDGLLIDLRQFVSGRVISLVTICTTFFFFYWLVVRKPNKKSWSQRPAWNPNRFRNRLPDLPDREFTIVRD